jgi:2-hydroxycyclohexanecarboxyl-CoA dehydrogenase
VADDPGRLGVAVVTGAASGLGAAITGALTATGWQVAGFDLRPGPATALGIEVDVTDPVAVESAVDRVERELGAVGALVTAAGVYEMLPVEEIDDARWQRMMAVNLSGTATTCAAVVPRMAARGRGGIVTVSSDLGVGGSQGDAHYAASKGAIVGFTRALATELEGTGVAVNTVAPGAADTPMLEATSPWRAALFLLQAGTAVSGQVLSPNAGATI